VAHRTEGNHGKSHTGKDTERGIVNKGKIKELNAEIEKMERLKALCLTDLNSDLVEDQKELRLYALKAVRTGLRTLDNAKRVTEGIKPLTP